MRLLLLCLMLSPVFLSYSQKKTSLSIDAGIFFLSPQDKNFVGSVIYHYTPDQKLAVGGGVEAAWVVRNGSRRASIAPRLDLRYFIRPGKMLYFPVAQLGYGLYSKTMNYNFNGTNTSEKTRGNVQYAFGIGVGRAVAKSSGDIFVLVRYAKHHYRSESSSALFPTRPNPYKTFLDGAMLTFGYRF